MFIGVLDKVVEVAEGIYDDVQPDETHQADNENLNELPQQIAVDDRGHGGERIQDAGCRGQGESAAKIGLCGGQFAREEVL